MGLFTCSFCLHLSILFVYSISATPVNDMNKGLSEFATEFYLQCAKEKPGNVIISPLSVSSALGLLSQAAADNTYEQLKQALHLGNEKSTIANQFLDQRDALEKNAGEATLSIANGIYVQEGEQLSKNFREVAVSKFKSGVESVNFADAKKSADTINRFVEAHTNGQIKDLFKPDQLSSDTVSVLVNAVHFKGDWEKPFHSPLTRKLDFYNSETESSKVDFMIMDSTFNAAHLNELDATALEMKYANSNISFVIVLPNSRTGLFALEAKLKDYGLTKVAEQLKKQRFDVEIPKFKVEFDINLNNVLKNMGMTDIFSENAKLSGVLESGKQLQVSDVVHKAFIEVTEKGTEAGASTGISMALYSMPPQFHADHPFVFFIRETQTNTVIFSGRIARL